MTELPEPPIPGQMELDFGEVIDPFDADWSVRCSCGTPGCTFDIEEDCD